MFKMSASLWNAWSQPNSPMINRLINDRLQDVRAGYMTNCLRNVASTHRHLAEAVDRPALVALINCLAEYRLQMYKF